MKKTLLALIFFIFAITYHSYSQRSFTNYYQMRDFAQASPGAFKFGLYGFDNPALLNYNLNPFDLMAIASTQENVISTKRWGLFTGLGGSGFGFISHEIEGKPVYDYRISTSFGSRTFGLGLTYGWTNEHGKKFGYTSMMQAGMLLRPNPNLSIGINHAFSLDNSNAETVAELAIRPIDYPFTIYGDIALFENENLKNARYSAGVSLEVLSGIRLNGRYFSDEVLALGIDLSFGSYGVNFLHNTASGGIQPMNSVGFRVGGRDRSIFGDFSEKNYYAILDLPSSIKYQRNRFFDNTMTLLDAIKMIDEATEDDNIKGMVINLTNFSANKSMIWEIRDKLVKFRNSGKRIVVFIDRADIDMYHLASVANEIVMDEMGYISITGYASGRSFYKRMLDDAGIGFEEIRLFKYKSAVENYSRTEMSEGEREQRKAYIDSWYEYTRKEICEYRSLTNESFDRIVDAKIGYFTDDAIKEKLVDKTGRWTELQEYFRNNYKRHTLVPIWYNDIIPEPIDDKWGEPKRRIAVYYLEGVCDMDNGIRARKAAQEIKAILESRRYDALILRVDSPGGDALASDYVAKIIRERSKANVSSNILSDILIPSKTSNYTTPVIVSQGMVAASGGYWLSMDADEIISSPFTITGSIGVISGWLYDKGIKDTIGIDYDFVKRGKYSDIGQSFTLPIIPIGLPLRNLTSDELEQRTNQVMSLYDQFISFVSKARKMDKDEVEKIAQGRIWTGADAIKNKLVDRLGGLDDAIQSAKDKAGIRKGERYVIDEFPEPKLFDFMPLLANLIGINMQKTKKEISNLDMLIQNNGKPMPMMSIEFWDLTK
jgi:protease-4